MESLLPPRSWLFFHLPQQCTKNDFLLIQESRIIFESIHSRGMSPPFRRQPSATYKELRHLFWWALSESFRISENKINVGRENGGRWKSPSSLRFPNLHFFPERHGCDICFLKCHTPSVTRASTPLLRECSKSSRSRDQFEVCRKSAKGKKKKKKKAELSSEAFCFNYVKVGCVTFLLFFFLPRTTMCDVPIAA